ncbi:MAG: hypothetical protein P8J66_02960 [Verrucomicrobiota bacterium]|nr:hypothetical protein [Verrucomicrobiota bacterium]
MKLLLKSMRRQLLFSLLLIPSLVGCQTRSRHTVVHHGPRPHVVREVITTKTSAKAAPDLQAVSMPEPPAEKKTVTIQTPDPMKLSPAALELVKLHESMVDESVILTFVDHSKYPFNLTADQIVYLQDIGVVEEVLSAMIQRDAYLTGEPALSVNDAPNAQQAPLAEPAAPLAENTTTVSSNQQPVYATNPPTSSPAPQTTVSETRVVTNEYFHEQLAPYGAWVHVADYGWCWRPTVAVANVNWRPYYDNGRWIYSDQGWYWHSNYSWGWAPFHYGRWTRHTSFGWVWAPDTVWGPSWVTWRYSNDYCGWAPLPPAAYYQSGVGFTYLGSRVSLGFGFGLGYTHYAFVSRRHFTHHRLGRHGLGPDQSRNIYNRTTIVNNYNIVNNNTVINNGITPERIAAGNTQEIKRIPLKEVSSAESTRLASTDSRKVKSLPVFRPKLPEQSSKVPERILNKQSSRVAMVRPQKKSERITLNRGSSDSLLSTSSLSKRPSVGGINRNAGNRSSEAHLKRPSSSSSLKTSSRPATSRSISSRSSRISKVQPSRNTVSSRTSQPDQSARPVYAKPAAKLRPSNTARSSSTTQGRNTFNSRPGAASESVSSRPRTLSPRNSSRPSVRVQPNRTRSEPRVYNRPSPQLSRRPAMRPRSTPAPRNRSIAPRSQAQPSRSISRPAPSSSRSSSGSVRQRSMPSPSSRSVPSFRSSVPASGSRPSNSSPSSDNSSSSNKSSTSSRPSRPGR